MVNVFFIDVKKGAQAAAGKAVDAKLPYDRLKLEFNTGFNSTGNHMVRCATYEDIHFVCAVVDQSFNANYFVAAFTTML